MQVSPGGIALKRFIETALIVIASALIVVLPLISAALQPCSTLPAPGQAAPSCAVPWNVIVAAFIVALISGAINALTSFIGAVHFNTQQPQLAQVGPPLGPSETVLVAPVPVADKPAQPVVDITPTTLPEVKP